MSGVTTMYEAFGAVQVSVAEPPLVTCDASVSRVEMRGRGPVAGTVDIVSRSSLSQRSSAVPLTYRFEPLSATIIPYCLSAVRITCACGPKWEMSKSALRRKRMPMTEAPGLEVVGESCTAGEITPMRLFCTVKRSA